MSESKNNDTPAKNILGSPGVSRKKFLQFAGMSAATAATFGLVGCDDEDDLVGPGPDPDPDMVNLGSGDVGVLNFAYALEQLEAAFYIQVMDNPYSGMGSTSEQNSDGQILEDLRKHEVAHRDWFSAVLDSVAPQAKIPELTPNFESVDFGDKMSVLQTAAALEETGVGAYNGAGQFITTGESSLAYLLQAGKIVSVEARHSSAINNLLNPGSADFAGDLNPDTGFGADENGLDQAFSVDQVLDRAGPFIDNEIDASNVGQ